MLISYRNIFPIQYPVVSKLIFSLIALVLKLTLISYVVPEDVLGNDQCTAASIAIATTPLQCVCDSKLYFLPTADPLLSFPHRFLKITTTCIEIRCRYYFIWLLVDSINNLAGLGFNGYDKNGTAKWDLVSNVFPMEIEFGLSLRQIANSWNANTSKWLRR